MSEPTRHAAIPEGPGQPGPSPDGLRKHALVGQHCLADYLRGRLRAYLEGGVRVHAGRLMAEEKAT